MKRKRVVVLGATGSIGDSALKVAHDKSRSRCKMSIFVSSTPHEVQLVNYLTATGFDEGVLLNFGAERLEFKKKFRLPKSEPVSL